MDLPPVSNDLKVKGGGVFSRVKSEFLPPPNKILAVFFYQMLH
jgi:hypothetical protein